MLSISIATIIEVITIIIMISFSLGYILGKLNITQNHTHIHFDKNRIETGNGNIE